VCAAAAVASLSAAQAGLRIAAPCRPGRLCSRTGRASMTRVKFDDLEMSYECGLMLHNGEPFTGVAFALDQNGHIIEEAECVDGMMDGIVREWSADGILVMEESLAFNILHGSKKRWFQNGNLKSTGEYELGICIRETEFSETGETVREYALTENDWHFDILKRYRSGSIAQLIEDRKRRT
jgi:antitoxin component YwqK of YwqJK toxin-antitoxin module